MDDLFIPLSDEEFGCLEAFLLGRIDAGADTANRNEGVVSVSGLDGLFTAIVSGPTMVPTSAWLPALWGDYPPAWKGEEEFTGILSLLIRHMNDIAYYMMEQPEDFEPIYLERVVEGRKYIIVDDWCEGYSLGVDLDGHWEEGGKEMQALLAPILAFSSKTNWRGHEHDEEQVEAMQKAIADRSRVIHAYWLERREQSAPMANMPFRGDGPHVGRNDPCPCGSGRKYKHCCLH